MAEASVHGRIHSVFGKDVSAYFLTYTCIGTAEWTGFGSRRLRDPEEIRLQYGNHEFSNHGLHGGISAKAGGCVP